jgi:hypothetical protein
MDWAEIHMHGSHSIATECMQQISWNNWCFVGYAIAQMVIHCILILEPLVQSQVTSCEIHGGWSGTVAGSSPSFFGLILLIINQTFLHSFVTPCIWCEIALTRQNIVLCLRFHASSLTQHFVGSRVSTLWFMCSSHVKYILFDTLSQRWFKPTTSRTNVAKIVTLSYLFSQY